MKSPNDASRKMDGERCTKSLSIPDENLEVCYSYLFAWQIANFLQNKGDGVYDVLSCTDVGKHYRVIVTKNMCVEQPSCIPQCNSVRCQYLCRHMISCSCWDYTAGHLCKHCHKVWSVSEFTGSCQVVPQESLVDFYNPEAIKESKAGKNWSPYSSNKVLPIHW